MRDVLAHKMDDGTETFSMLATMTYKTEEHAISSILIHEITTRAGNAADADGLGNIICGILSEQWNRCLKEEVVIIQGFVAADSSTFRWNTSKRY